MRKLLVMFVFVASVAHGEVFTWTDSRGVAHYTNREYEVPARYRARAKVMYQDQSASPSQQNSQNQQAGSEGQAVPHQNTAGAPAPMPAPPAITVKPGGQQYPREGHGRPGPKAKRARGAASED